MHVVTPDMHHIEDVGQCQRRPVCENTITPMRSSRPPADGRKEQERDREQKGQPQRVGGDEVPQVGETLGPPGGAPALANPVLGTKSA